ncbi:MAG: hypothetical protein HFG33_03455 [Bacilli bacterium]|nr:hypothetical protein [Bacilli bacterium]
MKYKMDYRICQSCRMTIEDESQYRKNKEEFMNADYCKYCFYDSKFNHKVNTEEYIDSM